MIDYDIKNMIVYKLIKILDVVFCILMINWNVFVEYEIVYGVIENKG